MEFIIIHTDFREMEIFNDCINDNNHIINDNTENISDEKLIKFTVDYFTILIIYSEKKLTEYNYINKMIDDSNNIIGILYLSTNKLTNTIKIERLITEKLYYNKIINEFCKSSIFNYLFDLMNENSKIKEINYNIANINYVEFGNIIYDGCSNNIIANYRGNYYDYNNLLNYMRGHSNKFSRFNIISTMCDHVVYNLYNNKILINYNNNNICKFINIKNYPNKKLYLIYYFHTLMSSLLINTKKKNAIMLHNINYSYQLYLTEPNYSTEINKFISNVLYHCYDIGYESLNVEHYNLGVIIIDNINELILTVKE